MSKTQMDVDFRTPHRHHNGVFSTSISKNWKRKSRNNVLSLLHRRQLYGTKIPNGKHQLKTSYSSLMPSATSSMAPIRHLDLTTACAWNPRRLQNMILAVGCETPAGQMERMSPLRQLSSSDDDDDDDYSVSENPNNDDDDDEDDDSDTNNNSNTTNTNNDRSASFGRKRNSSLDNSEPSEPQEQEREDHTAAESSRNSNNYRGRRRDRDQHPPTYNSDQESSSASNGPFNNNYHYNHHIQNKRHCATMKHSGCINTASWLDSSWRLSFAPTATSDASGGFISSSSHSSNYSTAAPTYFTNRMSREDDNDEDDDKIKVVPTSPNEITTQLLTSGDDKLVKFWDVSQSIGRISPIDGPATICPYSTDINSTTITHSISKLWSKRNTNRRQRSTPLPGTVTHLATLHTGHRSNVFHATPIPNRPGKIATCAADGQLHMSDIELQSITSNTASVGSSSRNRTNSATVIMRPNEHNTINNDSSDDDDDMPLHYWGLRNNDMCFSHHFLDSNTGLVCSERGGLRFFDIRAPGGGGNGRNRRDLLKGFSLGGCKSCAIFSATQLYDDGDAGMNSSISADSAYVFAGGSSGDVGLYDLRFTSDDATKVVQTYRPSCFGRSRRSSSGITTPSDDTRVSVSGLDISKDKRELLVSYESDQVYTFPILPFVSVAGPTIEEMSSLTPNKQEELAGYGAHLNRHTFLKNAKYAGPRDEYICTGSDSGDAWIYEKATGSVVSLLRADKSTCNGIIPHPQLPLFVTYGIESTAKLWRGTVPVNDDVDDSDQGRWKYNNKRKYEMSALVRDWNDCRTKLSRLKKLNVDDEDCIFTPSEIVAREIGRGDDSMSVLFEDHDVSNDSSSSMQIGNNLQNLPQILLENYFACELAKVSEESLPVKCGFKELKRRIFLIRMHHQCNQLGIPYNPALPWKRQQDTLLHELKRLSSYNESQLPSGGKADLLPDCPSDWISFDCNLNEIPFPHGMSFNVNRYEEFFLENYTYRLNALGQRALDYCDWNNSIDDSSNDEPPTSSFIIKANEDDKLKSSSNTSTSTNDSIGPSSKFWESLEKNVLLLKNEGNIAVQSGNPNLAARYYDKAIQYCALGFTEFPAGSIKFIQDKQSELKTTGWHSCQWNELLKAFVSIRLNLSMIMLKPEIGNPTIASEQAKLALRDLDPFTSTKGKVVWGKKSQLSRDNEPNATYSAAKELEAKAYFRLGSAKSVLGSHSNAVQYFEKSIKCTRESNPEATIEKVVLRRLAEAKRAKELQKKNQRKRFKAMFSKKDKNVKDS